MKRLLSALLITAAGLTASASAQAPQAAPLQLWRLDCGDFVMKRFGAWFSDTFQYPAGARKLVGSCYLIRNGQQWMLWDTGLTDELVGRSFDTPDQTMTVKRSLVDQLKQLGLKPSDIGTVGISHYHADHTGQALHFPNARLLIGQGDWEALKTGSDDNLKMAQGHLAHWLKGPGKAQPVARDLDVFGDGRVLMLAMPGHTPGHTALAVRLASGPVLLSGDQYHFAEAVTNKSVPSFNTNRADTLASHDRFDRIAANVKAKVIIQHEPRDVAKLPAFPAAAQ